MRCVQSGFIGGGGGALWIAKMLVVAESIFHNSRFCPMDLAPRDGRKTGGYVSNSLLDSLCTEHHANGGNKRLRGCYILTRS